MEKPAVTVSEEDVGTADDQINVKTLILVAVLTPQGSGFSSMLTPV
jgi:hypothetical protein